MCAINDCHVYFYFVRFFLSLSLRRLFFVCCFFDVHFIFLKVLFFSKNKKKTFLLFFWSEHCKSNAEEDLDKCDRIKDVVNLLCLIGQMCAARLSLYI